MIGRFKKRKMDWRMPALVILALYGIILYAAAFRKIDGHHFEMALQPEKILLFFMIEEVYLFLQQYKTSKSRSILPFKNKKLAVNMIIFLFIASTVGYTVERFNHRFVILKYLAGKMGLAPQKDYSLLANEEKRPLEIPRGKGMIVPAWQADEIEGVVDFIEKNTKPNDPVFTFPELGNYNFWFDRPFVGRFPIVSFSWVDEGWHRELVNDLIRTKPRYAIMTYFRHRVFPAALYFRYEKNRRMYKEVADYISHHYKVVKNFPSLAIYQRK